MSALSDKRRNLGPTDFQPIPPPKQTFEHSKCLRKIFISQGIASHASGSAYLEVGNTKLLATVHGPQQLRSEFQDRGSVEVNVHVENFSGISNIDEVVMNTADFVRSSILPVISLKHYPKSNFIISLNVLNGEMSGSLLANAVNCVSMALVNAGVVMHDMVVGVQIVKTKDELFVDIDADFHLGQQIVASFSTNTKKLVNMFISSDSAVSREVVKELVEAAEENAFKIRKVLDSFLVEDYKSMSG